MCQRGRLIYTSGRLLMYMSVSPLSISACIWIYMFTYIYICIYLFTFYISISHKSQKISFFVYSPLNKPTGTPRFFWWFQTSQDADESKALLKGLFRWSLLASKWCGKNKRAPGWGLCTTGINWVYREYREVYYCVLGMFWEFHYGV